MVGFVAEEPVERLQKFYEAWWAELEPTFTDDVAIHLGNPSANPVQLTAHDWVAEQLTPWIPGDYFVLGTDGMGRSETREALRRHFEVDAESITIATLSRLAAAGVFTPKDVQDAISELGYDAEKPDPYFA